MLLLGKREVIEKYFPDFRIDLLEIPGNSYTDAKSRYTFRLDEQENLWEYYFECFARLKQKVDVTFKLSAEGFGEELSTGLTAIREALVNLLMHADYFSPAHSRIRIFTNKIEFFNPGGLPKPIEELKEKDLSIPRNPIISKLFRMVKLAENAGFGFDKIESNWFEYNKTAPVYKLEFDSVTTSFYFAANDNNETSEQVTGEATGEATEEATGEVAIEIQRIVVAINGEMKRSEIQSLLNLKHDDYFRTQYIIPALEKDYITMKFPDSPNHPQQRYILTRKGILLKKELI